MVTNVSGCSTESTKKTVDCIKNMDIETILALAKVSFCRENQNDSSLLDSAVSHTLFT